MKRSEQILIYLDQYQAIYNASPSLSKIAKAVGMKQTPEVYRALKRLERDGDIERIKHGYNKIEYKVKRQLKKKYYAKVIIEGGVAKELHADFDLAILCVYPDKKDSEGKAIYQNLTIK